VYRAMAFKAARGIMALARKSARYPLSVSAKAGPPARPGGSRARSFSKARKKGCRVRVSQGFGNRPSKIQAASS